MKQENGELQTKLNSKQKMRDRDDPTMDVDDVQWLTGPRGEEFREAVQEGRMAKKQKKDDADMKKAEAGAPNGIHEWIGGVLGQHHIEKG